MDPQNKEVRQCPIFDPKYYTHWSSLVPGPPWGKGPGDKANTGGMQLLHVYFCILHQIREEDLKWAQELVKQKEATKEQSEQRRMAQRETGVRARTSQHGGTPGVSFS